MNLEPRAFIPQIGSGMCDPIDGAGIIPPRFPVPLRLKSEPIKVTDEAIADASVGHLVRIVNEKLRLEDERVRRILPELPAGYSWRGEIQARDEIDFERNFGETSIRIVYRLHGPEGRLDISAREAWAWARET